MGGDGEPHGGPESAGVLRPDFAKSGAMQMRNEKWTRRLEPTDTKSGYPQEKRTTPHSDVGKLAGSRDAGKEGMKE